MSKKLVIADAGPIFSLAILGKLELLNLVFDDVKIPSAVWEDVSFDKDVLFYDNIETFFKSRVVQIKRVNDLNFIMDYGESESVILYQELNADFLLIDDKKARNIAENIGLKCIGTLGLLSAAKTKGYIEKLKPLFEILLANNRYYAIRLLNILLEKHHEPKFKEE